MSLFFQLAYLVGFKPWDSGVPPPELVEVVEGQQALESGRALDLGCGTGTNCIYLAEHGWDATGVDFVGKAVETARRKTVSSALKPRFVKGDVTRLEALDLGGRFDLLLDLGCYHSLAEEKRDDYASGVSAEAAPDATFLLFGFVGKTRRWIGPPGLAEDEVAQRSKAGFDVVWERRSEDARFGLAAWYRLRRRP
jgi:cyclopropane fatty-acyl-phospholipid synthase-like methyltransferase